jgi:Uma2 family endonuclease
MSPRPDLEHVPPRTLVGCTLLLPGDEVVVPPSAFTLGGFRAWARSDRFPRSGHISFIHPEILVDMSPEKIESHNKVKTEVIRVVANLNAKLELGEVYSDRTLLTNTEVGLSTEPDGIFTRWEALEGEKVRLVRHEGEEDYLEIEGSPDWVLEIVSESSVRKDTQILREVYYRAGILEYWLIDARGEEIDFQVLQRGQDGYVAAEMRRGWQRSGVFGRHFRLERRRGPLDLWQYTLRMKTAR